jgi:hypothetical protein
MALALTIQAQEEKNWCWLAVAGSVSNFFTGVQWQQCSLAQSLIASLPPGTTCCPTPTPTDCDAQGDPSQALNHVKHSRGSKANLAPFSDIANEIGKGNPVAVGLAYSNNNSSHVVLIINAWTVNGQDMVKIADPDGANPRMVRNVKYKTGGTGMSVPVSWGRTYFTKP